MISRAYTFLTIGRQLAKAAATAADRVPEGTPEERAEIARHVAAIYRILRGRVTNGLNVHPLFLG